MSLSQEKLSIILMRDSGESKRMRFRRSYFKLCMTVLLLCPFIAAAGFGGIYYLWEENKILHTNMQTLQQENADYKVTTKRLEHLEILLQPQNNVEGALAQSVAKKESTKPTANKNDKKEPAQKTSKDTPQAVTKENSTQNAEIKPSKEAAQSTAGATSEKPSAPASAQSTATAQVENTTTAEQEKTAQNVDDGPGHEAFPVLDTKEIIVQNVTSILSAKRRLRTSFDLRNEGKEGIAGEVFCILSLESGKTVRLTPKPSDAGTYKIARFKKAVLLTDIAADIDMSNAQLILEVKNTKGEEIFRNIYPISQ